MIRFGNVALNFAILGLLIAPVAATRDNQRTSLRTRRIYDDLSPVGFADGLSQSHSFKVKKSKEDPEQGAAEEEHHKKKVVNEEGEEPFPEEEKKPKKVAEEEGEEPFPEEEKKPKKVGEEKSESAEETTELDKKPEHEIKKGKKKPKHSGKPGKGGKPMVPRTHAHGKPEHKHSWSYAKPNLWKEEFKACGGSAQSPININTKTIVKNEKDEKLEFLYIPLSDRDIDNNGHNVQVDGNFGNLTLPDGNYAVAQFHFHFPSEHEVNGKMASGEMHIVHQKIGSEGTNDLAVIAILLEEDLLEFSDEETKKDDEAELSFLTQLGFDGTEPEPVVESLSAAPGPAPATLEPENLVAPSPSLPQVGESFPIEGEVDIGRAFAPQLMGGFYHYEGSLTTPPCSETVHWYVMERPAAVTKEMVMHFKSIFPSPANNRPVQKLHKRDVVDSDISLKGEFAESHAACSIVGSWLLPLSLLVQVVIGRA